MIIKGCVKRGPRLAKSNSNIEAMSMPWGNGLVNYCDLERHLVSYAYRGGVFGVFNTPLWSKNWYLGVFKHPPLEMNVD